MTSTTSVSTATTESPRAFSRCLAAWLALVLSVSPGFAAELMVTQVTDLGVDYDASHDSLVIAAMQRLWSLPLAGGEATALTPPGLTLKQPRVSPDGSFIVAVGGWQRREQHLWLIKRDDNTVRQLTSGAWHDHSPAWHPDSRQVLFVSDRSGDSNIWRQAIDASDAEPLTRGTRAKTDPLVTHADGRFVYIERWEGSWRLQQAMPGGLARTLHVSRHRLSRPTLRRDGVVITIMRHLPNGSTALDALLPVQEMLVKRVSPETATLGHAPVWLNRDRYVTVEQGRLVIRSPATRGKTPIPFTIWISARDPQLPTTAQHTLTPTQTRGWRLRAASIYDPVTQRLSAPRDIVVGDGRIRAIEPADTPSSDTQVDLGEVVVIPGLIDIDARVTPDNRRRWLAAGVTSYSRLDGERADGTSAEPVLPRRLPLPLHDLRNMTDNRDRIMLLRTQEGNRFITDQLLPDLAFGQGLLDASWFDQHSISSYEDEQLLLNRSGASVTSHFAERQQIPASVALAISQHRLAGSTTPDAVSAITTQNANAYGHLLVAASGESPLAPGLSLLAELLGMHAAGVSMSDVLAAATSRPAAVLGQPDIGRIQEGARADLVILAGNPLDDPAVLLSPVAIVADGELYSLPQLIETR